ncbi:MAG: ABC transporter permease [Candidatus Schekmanbacteria bacterium]|nr:ABC transporter permease [Candidatus Schekmanbacteria bacterium]
MATIQKYSGLAFVFAVLSVVLLIFITLPLFKVLFSADKQILLTTLQEQEVMASIGLTLRASLYATITGLVFGLPLAYFLARYDFVGKEFAEALIDLPVIVPHTAAGIALLSVFGRKFFLGRIFNSWGIGFMGSTAGIVLAMSFVSLPFLVNAAKEGFRSIDPRLERVARTLGATPTRVFWDVTIPLSSRHIISGAIMMWARGISEFGAVVILAYHPMIAPVLIYERFNSFGLKYAQPVAVILLAICLIIFFTLRVISRRQKMY